MSAGMLSPVVKLVASAEEGRAGVEAEVLEGCDGGDGREAGGVLDVFEGAAVGCLEGGAGRGS